jgi:hypothetical protein
LWPSDKWTLDPEPAVAFGTALTLWLVAELRMLLRRSAHPHDVEFIRRFRDTIPLDAVRYLKQHDFGSTYDYERLDSFWKVDHEAVTPGYAPHDLILQEKFEAFRSKLREFSLLLVSNGGPIGASTRLCSILPDQERAIDEFSDQTVALVKRVNATADAVVRLHEEFTRAARERVPEAFGTRR